MRKRQLILGGRAAILAALLAGCTSMAPPLSLPADPLPAQYPADAPASDGAPAATTSWDRYFTDPELQRLVRQALACNRDLRQAVARVRMAASEVALQHAATLPAVDASLQAGRARVPPALSGVGRSVLGDQVQFRLGVSWELDLWGRLASLDEAALQTWLASEANRQALASALVAQVADAYLGLRELDERGALAESALASRNDSLRIFRRRYEAGSTSRLDLTQVETLQTQAESLVLQLRQARARQAHALALLTGLPAAPAGLPASAPARRLEDGFALPPLASGLPSTLLLARPDIVAAERQLRAAQANIGAARAAWFPRIALTAADGSASTALGGLFDGGTTAWSAGAALAMPVFDGGRNRASLRRAEAARDAALAAYERTVQGAFREVADALSAREAVARQLEVGERAVNAQRERARLAKLRYERGSVTFLDVLDAQRDLLQVEQQQVQNRRAVLSSQVALYLALGGGTAAGGGDQACKPEMTP